jgi:hypothetical protein
MQEPNPLGPTILEVLNEPQKMAESKKKSIRERYLHYQNSRNKSEAKAEEGANPTTLKLREIDLNACLTNPITIIAPN